MFEALQAAGFPGVEAEGGVVYARLFASGAEFHAAPQDGAWMLSLCWPVRLGAPELAAWHAAHPDTRLDIYKGETRLRMISTGTAEELALWGHRAEALLVLCIGYRRAQRARGEGM